MNQKRRKENVEILSCVKIMKKISRFLLIKTETSKKIYFQSL